MFPGNRPATPRCRCSAEHDHPGRLRSRGAQPAGAHDDQQREPGQAEVADHDDPEEGPAGGGQLDEVQGGGEDDRRQVEERVEDEEPRPGQRRSSIPYEPVAGSPAGS